MSQTSHNSISSSEFSATDQMPFFQMSEAMNGKDLESAKKCLDSILMNGEINDFTQEWAMIGIPEANITLSDDERQRICESGFAALPDDRFRQLLVSPSELLALSDYVLEHGGQHWNTVPVSDEIQALTQQSWEKLSAHLTAE